MRLIDADKLMLHLNDIWLSYSPDERESWYKRERALAVCVGLEKAMDAVKDAPTMTDGARNKTEKHILELYQRYYDGAVLEKGINDPVAWSLYQIWQYYDSARR